MYSSTTLASPDLYPAMLHAQKRSLSNSQSLEDSLQPVVSVVQADFNYRTVLFEADGQPTFSKFDSLAAELRVMVYELYIDAFTHDPDTLSPPPLGRSNSQLRREFLPVFYSRASFDLSFVDAWDYWNHGPRLEAVGPTRRLLRMIETSHSMAKLQRVRIRVSRLLDSGSRRYLGYSYEYLSDFRVDTGKSARSQTVTGVQGYDIRPLQIESYEAVTFTCMLESGLQIMMGETLAKDCDGKKSTRVSKVLGAEELTQFERWMPSNTRRWGYRK
jgi:hypothetical protein